MQNDVNVLVNTKLKKKDLAILTYLRSNARHTVTQIGRKLGIPRTTVFEKIKKLRKSEVIPKFTCIVDFPKLGYSIYAYVLFKTDPSQKEALAEALATSGHTNNVQKLGNDYDFMASMAFRNMEEMHNYLDILTQKYAIKETKIMYVTKDLKREGFLTASTVGMLFMAFGTSALEFTLDVSAAIKKGEGLAFGTSLGSVIMHIFFAGGLAAVINPVIFHFDDFIMPLALLFTTIAVFSGYVNWKKKSDWWLGLILLGLFIAFIALNVIGVVSLHHIH